MANRTYETQDLDLAAFLMSQGLQYLGSELDAESSYGQPKATLRFADEKQIARDLERVFLTSPEKRYRDVLKFLLREAHRTVKEELKS